MAEGKTLPAIAEQLGVHRVTVAAWGKSYEQNGLECLKEKPRTGRPQMIDGMQRASITALACSEAPEGYSQWSLRLLADRIVEMGICEELSHTEVAKVLKKTNLSRTSKKRGASGK
jgi:transposase